MRGGMLGVSGDSVVFNIQDVESFFSSKNYQFKSVFSWTISWLLKMGCVVGI